jgi:uncharacterized protein (TIGR02001 family)
MQASRKLGIVWLMVAPLASSAGAETRVYATLASNYVFRGASLTDDDPSVGGGLDWQHGSGAYGGAALTSVLDGVEVDGYAGYTHRFGAFAIDAGATYYDYATDSYLDGNAQELFIGGQVGPLGLSVFRGDSVFGRYWYGQVDAALPAGPLTLELHYGLIDYGVGEQVRDEYVGFVATWHGFDWRVRLTQREEGDEDIRFVAAISRSWTVRR